MSIKEKYMRMLEHGIAIDDLSGDVSELLKHLSSYMQESTNSRLFAYKSADSELSGTLRRGVCSIYSSLPGSRR